MRRKCLCPMVLVLGLLPAGAGAQSPSLTLPQTIPQSLQQPPSAQGQTQEQPADQYIPLFTPEQIAKASKESRKRMEATEKMNREAWEKRRTERAAARAKAQSPAPPPPPPKYTRKGKIYKWVDAQGRVHFGDAPGGKDSQQIKLRNTQPPEGAPPPPTAPHLKGSGEDS